MLRLAVTLVAILSSVVSGYTANLLPRAACTVYTVVSGDTCDAISAKFGITTTTLISYNSGLVCTALAIGQRLCVTSGTLPPPTGPYSNGTCESHMVVSGDTCSAIALEYDVTVANIEAWNTAANTYKWEGCSLLQVGYNICVSNGTAPYIPINPALECGPESTGNATCPLKACCSYFGYCGLTSEFCTTGGTTPCLSNCFTPSLPSCSATSTARKMGYYAGWATNRTSSCNPVGPGAIDLTGYTHVHYAFATISQTYQIQITSDDGPLITGLVARKKDIPGLKVIIAVGGWDFSEDDPTKDLFTVMISTAANRATFISSVATFLTTYGLDGIDIDFEYPAAIERDAPATDTPNLTAFFSQLRTGLPSGTIISAATPAGYWFLKGFEIDQIVGNVTYLNMMAYDYHGDWDVNVTGQAPVTNPHTSILDITDSVLLYTRAGISMADVNLGLAWYARTYHVASSSCLGYNCTMTGGGAAGPCTGQAGILAQFEVDMLIKAGNTPILDTTSETYYFNDAAGDLATFDQQTIEKSSFAASTCFGGTFDWSLDQVVPTTTTTTYAPAVTCTPLFAAAKNRVDEMMTYFVPPPGEGGFFVSEPDDAERLWTDANKWETIYNYMEISADKSYDIFNQAILFPYPDGSSGPNWNNLFQGSYDDALWTSLMYFKVGDYKKDTEYYKFALGILSYVRSSALDTTGTCGTNGVWWSSAKNYKNTVTNGLFLLANTLAYQKATTGQAGFLSDAQATWAWLYGSGLRVSDNTWIDGIGYNSTTGACTPNGGAYTYNQGLIPAGLANLYTITGSTNTTYLMEAELTLNAVMNMATQYTSNGILYEPICEITENCNNDRKNGPDRMTFKGLFMKHLMYYIQIANGAGTQHSGIFASAIWKQYQAILDNASDSNNGTGEKWHTNTGQYYDGYTDQAGIDAILAATLFGGCPS